MFRHDEIVKLLKGDPIDSELPFDSNDDESVRSFYEPIIHSAEQRLDISSIVDWRHYGSGYASFVDAWFYRSDGAGRISSFAEHHIGIWVLLSRTTRYFVTGQGEKSWHSKGGSSYMPCFDDADSIDHTAIAYLASPLIDHFSGAGLIHLTKLKLADELDKSYGVPGILSCPPFRHFDALFHWED